MELAAERPAHRHPHTPGTREYLTCISGRIELVASGERWQLEPGDASCSAATSATAIATWTPGPSAVAISVVCFAPVSEPLEPQAEAKQRAGERRAGGRLRAPRKARSQVGCELARVEVREVVGVASTA